MLARLAVSIQDRVLLIALVMLALSTLVAILALAATLTAAGPEQLTQQQLFGPFRWEDRPPAPVG